MSTRDKLIEETANLIRRKGYYGSGIREILETTEVPKGSLYHHFPTGKDGLVKEALIYSSQLMQEKFITAMRKQKPKKALKGIIRVLRSELEESNYANGCPIATVALEISTELDGLRLVCDDLYRNWQDGLTQFLQKRDVANAARKAQMFLIQLEGAYLMAKARKDATYFDVIEEEIENLLKD